MLVKSLGYVGLQVVDVDAWQEFAAGVLGMQTERVGDYLALRIDDRRHRILVQRASHESAHFGWDVGDHQALTAAAEMLEGRGVKVHHCSREEIEWRGVADAIWLTDPLDNRIELFHGLAPAQGPFRPERPISGFRTGALGLGHVVLTVPDMRSALAFYQDTLGFRLSDYAVQPFHAVFLHINARHHSLALLETGQPGLHHIMTEVLSVDDVGRAYDAALERERVGVTLGRHTNDHMLSFYAWSPSRFLFEYGWGGRSVDDATWQVEEMANGPSLWGHERSWLSLEKQVVARRLRAEAAARGLRAPVHVTAGQYDENAADSA
ncbi:MAG: biphenyl 2,3-dioxygenase [Proteobacteria bacterium]|nr:MAG: biphenyl 2,3-dioxygenase [Pseudomonadota bacterium]